MSIHGDRLSTVAGLARRHGVDAILVTPGPDLRFLVGYDAVPLERLTCLLVPAEGPASVIVPGLEVLAAQASPIGDLGLEVHPWAETDDPFALVRDVLGPVQRVALDDRMWAEKVLRLRMSMPATEQMLAGPILQQLRMRKDPAELASLRLAGAAIDRVHAQIPGLLRPGRTEREVGRDIAELIIGAGHTAVDFIIVASGPNGASPHHEVSDRRLESGDPVVIDIGGTMPDGYRSDCTRMYCVGEPDAEFLRLYDVLQRAQDAGCEAVRPGVTCADIDEATRRVLEEAGLGEYFIHRTGHGIGLETHEAPYIVAGNETVLEPGMTFSIEPGVYLTGRFGARIEDIVACTADGVERFNHQPRELIVVT